MDNDLSAMSVADLIARFEKDIRFGCHSTRAEASRSLAGQELERRGEETIQAIQNRLKVIQTNNDVDLSVRTGLTMLLHWTTGATCVSRLAANEIEDPS